MRVKSASVASLSASLMSAAMLSLAGCASRPTGAPVPDAATRAGSLGSSTAAAAVAEPADAAARMIDTARAMIGQPYRYGGAAPGGFDCSGLVRFAAQSAGIALPRTAGEQLRAGVRIDRAEVAPGDLVFMRLARKDLHVGIAIGGGRFIHAPAAGGHVRIDSLAAEPYSGGFIGARRVISGATAAGF